MHTRTQDYVELFPVHPTYFENFERIQIGKSQREILKTLSHQFELLLDKDVPSDTPGLLTYERYWDDIKQSPGLAPDNALRIRNAITDLQKGLDKVELSSDDMKSTFNKPFTPDEATEAFKAHINRLSKGKERDKVRIILK